jgi:hypothetical protein
MCADAVRLYMRRLGVVMSTIRSERRDYRGGLEWVSIERQGPEVSLSLYGGGHRADRGREGKGWWR